MAGHPDFRHGSDGRFVKVNDDDRFWSKVDADGDCWVWTAARYHDGYGQFDRFRAHRWAYERLVGPIPDGLQLDHLCRNRACVNPDHLEPVTNDENMARSPIHNRAKTHCKRGHAFTPENTYLLPRDGGRKCRACARTSDRQSRQRRRDRAQA